jgi:hypothetical protein
VIEYMRNGFFKLGEPMFSQTPMRLPQEGVLAPYWEWLEGDGYRAKPEVILREQKLMLKGIWSSEEQKERWLTHHPEMKAVSVFERSGWLPIVKMTQTTVWVKMDEDVVPLNVYNSADTPLRHRIRDEFGNEQDLSDFMTLMRNNNIGNEVFTLYSSIKSHMVRAYIQYFTGDSRLKKYESSRSIKLDAENLLFEALKEYVKGESACVSMLSLESKNGEPCKEVAGDFLHTVFCQSQKMDQEEFESFMVSYAGQTKDVAVREAFLLMLRDYSREVSEMTAKIKDVADGATVVRSKSKP